MLATAAAAAAGHYILLYRVSRRQLLHKLTHLKLGANPGEQLHAMRMKAYRLERNDLKDTRPKWYSTARDTVELTLLTMIL